MIALHLRAPRPRAALLCALASVLPLAAHPALAVTHLKPGMTPPPIALMTLEGTRLSLEDARGRPLVVLFGELYHEKTLLACAALRSTLEEPALDGQSIATMLVIAQDAERETLRTQATDPRLPAAIVHDARRKAYADYRVTVMPSAVVLDSEGKVVHALAGYTARFGDIVTDALLLATGRIDRAQFEQALHPKADRDIDESRVRARRIARLAAQLAQRGLPELAEEKYAEALGLAPDLTAARLGLGMLKLRRRQLAEAEAQFRAVLDADAASTEAALALAYVQTLRGGAELDDALGSVRNLIAEQPDEPRAHYVMGLIHEQRGEPTEAIASFRRATELLMGHHAAWSFTPGRTSAAGAPVPTSPPGGAP